MNRYSGNSGIVERIPEPQAYSPVAAPPVLTAPPVIDVPPENTAPARHAQTRPLSPPDGPAHHAPQGGSLFGGGLAQGLQGLPLLGGLFGGNGEKPPEQSLFGGLGGLLSKLTSQSLELEDYLLLGILYLLYRESGDIEFLLIAGGMLLL